MKIRTVLISSIASWNLDESSFGSESLILSDSDFVDCKLEFVRVIFWIGFKLMISMWMF